ncbi:MAG TPA: hypothetical protein VFV05_12225 [Methylomirabilota bacterium]|nr:hypothetical protein [Methylomirabilota bacterium]
MSAVVGGLGLVLTTALMSIAVTLPRVGGPPAVTAGAAPWSSHLDAVDLALQTNDVPAALKAWHAAYGAALASRRWDGFADAGDAYLRVASAAGAAGAPRARDLYLSALFRARDAGSRDGALRVAAAFAGLGDREVATQARRIARRLPATP